MADFDEELRRQAAISSLLAQQPDTPDPSDSDQGYAESMAPVIKPDTQEDYHKLINQAFDTKTDEQVTPVKKFRPHCFGCSVTAEISPDTHCFRSPHRSGKRVPVRQRSER